MQEKNGKTKFSIKNNNFRDVTVNFYSKKTEKINDIKKILKKANKLLELHKYESARQLYKQILDFLIIEKSFYKYCDDEHCDKHDFSKYLNINDIKSILKNANNLLELRKYERARQLYTLVLIYFINQPDYQDCNKNDFAEAFINFAMVMHCLGESKFAENALCYVFRKFYFKSFKHLTVMNKATYYGVLAYIKYVKYEQSQKFNYLKEALGDFTMAYNAISEEIGKVKRSLVIKCNKMLARFAHGQGTIYYFMGDYHAKKKCDIEAREKYVQSVKKFEEALMWRIIFYGSNDVNVARSYHKLATAFVKLEKIESAECHFKKALDIQCELLDKNHPNRRETQLAYNRFKGYKMIKHKNKKINQYEATTYGRFYGKRKKTNDNNITCSKFNKILDKYFEKRTSRKFTNLFKDTRSDETKQAIIKCVIARNNKERMDIINAYMRNKKNRSRRFGKIVRKAL